MSVKALRNMKKRLKILEVEVERIKGTLATLSQYEDEASIPLASEGGTSGGSVPQPHKGPKPAEVMKVSRDIILNHGLPMKRAELFQALVSSGFQFVGERAINTLGVTLSRNDDKFENIEGYGYWPKDVACPEVGYDPDEEFEEEPEKYEPTGAALH